jgi:transcriptional regulator with XRE-family HTH domain
VTAGFDSYCKRFGGRVRDLRLRAGLTQEDMMERGFSLRHYQRIEAGRSVTLQTLWKLARAFDIDPRRLLPPV